MLLKENTYAEARWRPNSFPCIAAPAWQVSLGTRAPCRRGSRASDRNTKIPWVLLCPGAERDAAVSPYDLHVLVVARACFFRQEPLQLHQIRHDDGPLTEGHVGFRRVHSKGAHVDAETLHARMF